MMIIVIHSSDSRFGNAVLIDSWHAARGFKTPEGIHIGYHFVVLNGQIGAKKRNSLFNGVIETGRPIDDDSSLELDEIGAHALGHNMSVGICLIGLSNTYSPKQINSLRMLIKHLRIQFGSITVMQHSDIDKKKPHCAGLDKSIMNELNEIETK